jgi:hypothetical protein
LEGEIEGVFDTIAFSWREAHIAMTNRVRSKWLRSGFIEHGTRFPTTAGVPQGGLRTPLTKLQTFFFGICFPSEGLHSKDHLHLV